MKTIKTVQDLIDELMLVPDKNLPIFIVATDGEYDSVYTPGSYDFTIKHPGSNSEYENVTILEMYR